MVWLSSVLCYHAGRMCTRNVNAIISFLDCQRECVDVASERLTGSIRARITTQYFTLFACGLNDVAYVGYANTVLTPFLQTSLFDWWVLRSVDLTTGAFTRILVRHLPVINLELHELATRVARDNPCGAYVTCIACNDSQSKSHSPTLAKLHSRRRNFHLEKP